MVLTVVLALVTDKSAPQSREAADARLIHP
jgi:hypothetical protein